MKEFQQMKCRRGARDRVSQSRGTPTVSARRRVLTSSLIGIALCGPSFGQVRLDPAGGTLPSGDEIPIGPRGPNGAYQYDDSEIDGAIGGITGELCWIHTFDAQAGFATITSVSTSWGAGAVNGAVGRVFVWEDPTDDGNPADAVLLHEQNVVVSSRCSGYGVVCPPIEYQLSANVQVSGKFFVGASTQMNTDFVAPLDFEGGYQPAQKWYDYDVTSFNPNALSNAVDDPGFVGVWMLRASGTVAGFSYQGRLRLNGEAVDGTADLEFRLYDSSLGGTQIGQTVLLTDVGVQEGLFTVQLPYTAADFAVPTRYLEIRAAYPAGGALISLTPRQSVSPTPQAFHAFQVNWNGVQSVPAGFADGTDDSGSSMSAPDGAPANVLSIDNDGRVLITGPTRLASAGTLLHGATNDSGVPNGDGFRLRVDAAFFGGSSEAFVFEKTDGIGTEPDGGFAFVNTAADNIADTAMVIRGSGNVGIGLNAPTAKLHVGGTAGTDGIRFPDNTLQTSAFALAGNGAATSAARSDHTHSSLAASDGVPAQAVAVNADGDVGIGTVAPEAPLNVATVTDVSLAGGGAVVIGSLTATNIAIDDNEIMARNNAATSRLSLQTEGGQVVIGSGSGIADTAPHRLIAVDTQPGLLSLPVRVDNGSSTTGSSTGIGFRVTGTPAPKGALAYERTGQTFGRGKFHFLQNPLADDSFPSLTDSVMTITYLGNVGVGVTEPVARLHVNGDSFWISGTDSGGLGTAAGAGLRVFNSATDSAIFAYDYATSTNRNLTLQNSGTGTGGNVGIGRAAAANKLEVEGNASKTSSGSWLANSDRRIKQNIRTVTNALDTLDRVRLVSFQYTDAYRSAHPSLGDRKYLNVIAQEFADVFPDWVQASCEKMPDGSDMLQVDTYPLTIYSAAAVQELHQKLRERDERIAALEARLERIEALLAADAADELSTSQVGRKGTGQ